MYAVYFNLTQPGATGQSELGSKDNNGVLNIAQSSSITIYPALLSIYYHQIV